MESQNNEEIAVELRSIKSIFETGEIKRMYEISKLYPTKIIRALGLNHGRYVNKLAKPEKFTISEIVRFSRLIGVDHYKVIDVILREAIQNVIQKSEKNKNKNKPIRKPNSVKSTSKSKKAKSKS